MSETDIILRFNVSERGYTHHTYKDSIWEIASVFHRQHTLQ